MCSGGSVTEKSIETAVDVGKVPMLRQLIVTVIDVVTTVAPAVVVKLSVWLL